MFVCVCVVWCGGCVGVCACMYMCVCVCVVCGVCAKERSHRVF